MNIGYVPEDYMTWKKKQLVVKAGDYTLIMGQLYKLGPDEILHRCISDHERKWVMAEAHVGVLGVHYVGKETMHNILQTGLWWPTVHMDTRKYCRDCDKCQRTGKPSRRDEMPLATQIHSRPLINGQWIFLALLVRQGNGLVHATLYLLQIT